MLINMLYRQSRQTDTLTLMVIILRIHVWWLIYM
nr:MAG TPA: hypothetical protein [Bacteriophage sp.]